MCIHVCINIYIYIYIYTCISIHIIHIGPLVHGGRGQALGLVAGLRITLTLSYHYIQLYYITI